MKQVKYILVNETGSESAVRAIRNSRVSDFRYCIIVNGIPGRARNEGGSSSRAKTRDLINQLVELRRQWPEAPILGVSELDPSARYAPIRVSETMNQLRRELSEVE